MERSPGQSGDARGEVRKRLAQLGDRGYASVVVGAIGGDESFVDACSPDGRGTDAASIFEIGSVTKALTGVLLADMSLQGEVSLDDPLSCHLRAPRPVWRHREPTLLELATHRSGLGNAPKGMSRRELAYSFGWTDKNPWARMSQDDYARLVRRQSPRREPGRRIRYSSMAVGLLGDALAQRAGRPYEQLLKERVLAPLGMTATAVTVAPAWSHRVLQGHARNGELRAPIEDLMTPAGGLRSNAADMLRFLAACLDPPGEPPGPALVLAQRPHVRLNRRLHLGLCWFLSGGPGTPRVVWHAGGTWGFRCFAGLVPGRGAAVVVMSNTARSVDRLGFQLLEKVAAAPRR